MSVTSTRRVSTSYSSSIKPAYEANQGGRQSFVETIDTTNNVSVQDEKGANQTYSPHEEEKENFEQELSNETNSPSFYSGTSSCIAPLIDNDEENSVVEQNRNVQVYGVNQQISHQEEDRSDNPYLKHLYENNEVIEDIDELI